METEVSIIESGDYESSASGPYRQIEMPTLRAMSIRFPQVPGSALPSSGEERQGLKVPIPTLTRQDVDSLKRRAPFNIAWDQALAQPVLMPASQSEGPVEGNRPQDSSDPSSTAAESAPDMSESPDDTEKWVEERMKRTEAEVGRMTDRVESSLENLQDTITTEFQSLRESNERFKAEMRADLSVMEESNKWTYRLVAVTLSLLVVFIGVVSLGGGQAGEISSNVEGMGPVLLWVMIGALGLVLLGAIGVGVAARNRGKSFFEWTISAFPNPKRAVRDLRQEDGASSSDEEE